MDMTATLASWCFVLLFLCEVNCYHNNQNTKKSVLSNITTNLKRKQHTHQSMVATSEPTSTSTSFIPNGKDHIYGRGALHNNKNNQFLFSYKPEKIFPKIYGGSTSTSTSTSPSPSSTDHYIDTTIPNVENQIPVIVGIAGGSGSGKTTLTQAIVRSLGPEFVTLINHDSYYKDLSHLSIDERAQNNFDHPDSLDTELLKQHLLQLKLGKTVQVPEYCYKTHSRQSSYVETHPRRIVIVDGILLFHDTELCNLMDMKIFVDAEDDVRLIRRIRRDTTERARSVDSVIDQYSTTVKPMHYLYVEPSKKNADIIIPSNHGIQAVALELILSRLREIINYYQ